MYMFVCSLSNGKVLLARPIDSKEEAEFLVDLLISKYGADYLGSNGVKFNVELAV